MAGSSFLFCALIAFLQRYAFHILRAYRSIRQQEFRPGITIYVQNIFFLRNFVRRDRHCAKILNRQPRHNIIRPGHSLQHDKISLPSAVLPCKLRCHAFDLSAKLLICDARPAASNRHSLRCLLAVSQYCLYNCLIHLFSSPL